MAVKGLKRGELPIHHSDRGSQYASHLFVGRVKSAKLKMSMTESNHCAENAMAERVNGILKQEYWLDAQFGSDAEARRAVTNGVNTYNNRRPHCELGLETPATVHERNRKH